MPRRILVSAVLLSTVLVMRYPRSAASFAASEQARVRAHLESAERELRVAPVAGLTLSQRAARERALERLHEYWVRGVFPRNTDFPNERVPYFIDRHGTRCAMAHLIEQAGDAEFVARVTATQNNAPIRDWQGDPELVAWVDANGITAIEAARIQPAYGCEGVARPPCPELPNLPSGTSQASTGYKTTTGMSVGVDVLAVALNSLARTGLSPTVTGAIGIASGALGIVVGAPNFNESGSRRTLGFVNAGVGAVSAAIGVYRLTGKRPAVTPVSFAPWVSTNGAPGLSGRITF